MLDKDLTVIIPSYNEAQNLEIILPKLKEVLDETNLSYEVLILDTMEKTDNTEEICQKYNFDYIKREGSNNYCDAVKTGIKYVKGNKTIFLDADGSHNVKFIFELLKYKDEYDIVVASRYVEGGGSDNNLILKYMSRILNKTYSSFLNVKCNDISNGFKLYDTLQLKSLELRCSNFDIIEEIIYKLFKEHPDIKLKELPYYFENRKYGKTKRKLLLFIMGYIFTLVRLKLSYRKHSK